MRRRRLPGQCSASRRPSCAAGGAGSLAAVLVLGALLAGCREHAGPAVVARDSAGVRIVESRAPAWRPGQAWHLTTKPIVSIGVVAGDPHYELSRVTDAARLPGGGIVVANATTELRFYDARGRYLRTVGRRGEGPGEFHFLRQVLFADDSLWTYDSSLDRLALFDTAGVFVRTVRLHAADGAGLIVGVFADGSLFFQGNPPFPTNPHPGPVEMQETLYRIAPTGQVLDSLGAFPSAPGYMETVPHGIGMYSLLLGPNSATAAGAARFFFGTARHYRISVYGEHGHLEAIYRRPVPAKPVTSRDVDSLIQAVQAGIQDADQRRNVARRLRTMHHATTMGAYTGFHTDPLDDLWVGEHVVAARTPARWSVFGPHGRWLGDVAVPAHLTIYEIGADYVLGARTDSLGVQRVALYGLVKPAS